MSDNPSPKTLAVVFTVVGLLCLWTGTSNFSAGMKARNWPSTTGTILGSSLEERSDAESTSLIPHLKYSYSVDGQFYVSKRITFAQQALNNDPWSQDLIERHPKGSQVKVYYNPSNPWEAALFVGVTPVSYFQPVFGLGLLIAAAMIVMRLRWRGSGNRE